MIRELAPERDGRDIEPETRLLDVGFDSLACADFAAQVQERYGLDITDGHVIGAATAGELAGLLDGAAQTGRTEAGLPVGLGRFRGSARRAVSWLMRRWFELEVGHAERMPPEGPVVMCMNHESSLDIPVAVAASTRPVTFMAKKELFERPVSARLLHELGGFSVERGAFDLWAVEVALAVLERGEVLGMYPEGTRTPGALLPFLPGAAWLALKTGASLLPVAIEGTGAAMPKGSLLPRRSPVRISFGEPVPVEKEADPAARRREAGRLSAELRDAVAGMLPADRNV